MQPTHWSSLDHRGYTSALTSSHCCLNLSTLKPYANRWPPHSSLHSRSRQFSMRQFAAPFHGQSTEWLLSTLFFALAPVSATCNLRALPLSLFASSISGLGGERAQAKVHTPRQPASQQQRPSASCHQRPKVTGGREWPFNCCRLPTAHPSRVYHRRQSFLSPTDCARSPASFLPTSLPPVAVERNLSRRE